MRSRSIGIDHLFGFFPRVSVRNGAPNLLRPWRIKEYVKRTWMFAQEKRRSAANNDRVSFLPDAIHDVLHHRHHAISIEDLIA